MGVLCFVYMICALRTNVVFVGIFLFLIPTFSCLAGAYWHLAQGSAPIALKLITAGGACAFIVCVLGWWIFAAIMLASLDFPFSLPGGFPRPAVPTCARAPSADDRLQSATSLTSSRAPASGPKLGASTASR